MNSILIAVRRARRRLVAADFVRLLAASFFWAGLVGATLILAWRLWGTIPTAVWIALAVLPACVALALALYRRPSLRTAAIALDQSAGLDERVGAALYVRDDGTPAARAVLLDAERAVERAGEKTVAIAPPPARRLLLPVLLAAAAGFLPLPGAGSGAEERSAAGAETTAPVPERVRKKQSARLRRRAFTLERRARELKKPELKEIAQSMRKIAEELRKKETSRNEALAKVSRIEEKTRDRKDQLSSKFSESLRRRMKQSGRNDAREGRDGDLTRKIGDLKRAAEELREKAGKGARSPEEQRKLDESLRKLTEALEDMLGDEAAFSERLDELNELLDGTGFENLEDLSRLAEALGRLEGDLANLELWDALEGELAELFALKEGLGEGGGLCPFCGGMMAGMRGGVCGSCGGLAHGAGVGPGGGPGAGTGGGPGRGPEGRYNPDDPTAPTKVKGNLSAGDIIGAIQFKSLPRKGALRSAYEEAYRHMSAEAAEALQQVEIPPGYRLHVRDYFDSIRPDREK